ncbi:MAG: DNA translocase FtsK 4TM domain-containing protein [Planctomycetota bacterium]|nr:DNA translocase FtsK 4TM domain-containing protein [Planctomycetota bacterium]
MSSNRTQRRSRADANLKTSSLAREAGALALLAVTAYFFIALYSEYLVAHGRAFDNACGEFGSFIASRHFEIFGPVSSFLLALIYAVWAGLLLFQVRFTSWWPRICGLALFVSAVCFLEFRFAETSLVPGIDYRGGVIGMFFGSMAFDAIGVTGTTIFSFLALALGLMFATGMPVAQLLRSGLAMIATAIAGAGQKTPGVARKMAGTIGAAGQLATSKIGRSARSAKDSADSEVTEEEKELLLGDSEDEEEEYEDEEGLEEYDEDEEYEEDEEDEEYEEDEEEDEEEDDEEEEEFEEYAEEDDEEEPAQERTIKLGPEKQDVAINTFEEHQLTFDGVYSPPSVSFLDDPAVVDHEEGREELNLVATLIEETLQSFKIDAKVTNVQRGPVITQFELSLAAGIKVHKIVSLSDDLAMALSAQSVRVVAPIPGKPTVGIEVPNKQREMVVLKEILQSRVFHDSENKIPLLLGKDAAGEPIVEDLARMPHLLIAGSTGSGKSVCINAIITSLLMTRSPDDLKLILVDPKMVELSSFEDIPHLLTPVITDMKKAPAALEWLVRKMDQRYELFSKAGVRNLAEYNNQDLQERYDLLAEKTSHEEADQAPDQLPSLIIIIDELADLMMTSAKEVEASIIRLAQKSRAVGIHVILATQRPSVDVVTGLIKANLPARICFKVASRIDSRTILDRVGGERLLGMGDMLYLPPDTSDLVRAQCTYISDKELKKVMKHLRKESKPQFSQEIDTFLEGKPDGGSGSTPIADDLFEEAVRVILETGRGSTTLLQRRLGIGYTRASRLMDIMTEQGIVGAFKGSKAREIKLTLEEWEEMQAQT